VSTEQKSRVQAQFGGSAEAYVQSAGHAGGADLDTIVAWGRAVRPDTVLDVATGGGHTALAFAAFAPRVVATDLTPPMLEAARRHARSRGAGRIGYLAADVEALPFAAGAFAAVTCRIAAHHFPAVVAALREVARVLRPRGTFLLQDILGHEEPDKAAFILEVERRRDPSHVRSYSAREWTAFLRATGFTVMEQTVIPKLRPWEEWTGRSRMSPDTRAALDRFVLEAPAACREAFDFRVAGGRIESFTDRMLLLRAERD
jgi:ubiquinone/menaquinone biosynthesis C-methylase UbiE